MSMAWFLSEPQFSPMKIVSNRGSILLFQVIGLPPPPPPALPSSESLPISFSPLSSVLYSSLSVSPGSPCLSFSFTLGHYGPVKTANLAFVTGLGLNFKRVYATAVNPLKNIHTNAKHYVLIKCSLITILWTHVRHMLFDVNTDQSLFKYWSNISLIKYCSNFDFHIVDTIA